MSDEETRNTLRVRGRQELRELFGAEFTDRRDATTNDFNGPLRRLTEEFAYGTVWSRPGLDRKQRSMITLAMLCSQNRPFELRLHLGVAIGNGCSAEEIREIFTHAVAYFGFPAAIDALREAEAVLKEKGKL